MLDLAQLMVFHWTRMNCSNSKWNTINNDILLDSSLALFQQFQKVEISSKYMHNNAALKNREFTLRDIILRIIFNSVSTVLITVTVSKIQQSKINIWHKSRKEQAYYHQNKDIHFHQVLLCVILGTAVSKQMAQGDLRFRRMVGLP